MIQLHDSTGHYSPIAMVLDDLTLGDRAMNLKQWPHIIATDSSSFQQVTNKYLDHGSYDIDVTLK